MANFTTHQRQVHDTTANLFGETATWTPLAGGDPQVAKVNFNRPDKANGLQDLHPTEWEFSALDTWMEYRKPQFGGLHDSVASKAKETVTITDQNGDLVGTYRVQKVSRVWDGDTIKAQLVEVIE